MFLKEFDCSIFLTIQEYETTPLILHSSPVPCGIIQPHNTVDIPLILEVQERGPQEAVAYISIYGSEDPPLVSSLRKEAEMGDL